MKFSYEDLQALKRLGRELRTLSDRTGLLITLTAMDGDKDYHLTAWSRTQRKIPELSYTENPNGLPRMGRLGRKIYRGEEEYIMAEDLARFIQEAEK